jgi:hypothetical protein
LAGKLAFNGKLLSTLVAVGAAAVLVLGPTTTPAHAYSWPDPWPGPGIAPWVPPLPLAWGAPLPPTGWGIPPLASLDATPTTSTHSLDGWAAAAMPGPLAEAPGSQFRAAWLQAQLLQALNRGDAAAASVYLADDAMYSISDGIGLCGPLPCVGRTAIQPELERQVSIHVSYLPIGLDTSSNTVTGRFAITTDNITAAGVQRVLGTVTSETRTDKLSFVRLSLERDDSQTAQFLAWAMRDGARARGRGGSSRRQDSARGRRCCTHDWSGDDGAGRRGQRHGHTRRVVELWRDRQRDARPERRDDERYRDTQRHGPQLRARGPHPPR